MLGPSPGAKAWGGPYHGGGGIDTGHKSIASPQPQNPRILEARPEVSNLNLVVAGSCWPLFVISSSFRCDRLRATGPKEAFVRSICLGSTYLSKKINRPNRAGAQQTANQDPLHSPARELVTLKHAEPLSRAQAFPFQSARSACGRALSSCFLKPNYAFAVTEVSGLWKLWNRPTQSA